MVDEREDFIRVYRQALAPKAAGAVCGNLRDLFARGFGVTRKQAGQDPKTLRDDLQIFDVCDQSDGAAREAVLPVLHECLVKYVDEFDVLHGATLAGWQLKAQLTRKGEGFHAWHFEGSSFFLAKRVLAWTGRST